MDITLPILFGRWVVTEEGIIDTKDQNYFIPRDSLDELRHSNERPSLYDWPLQLVEKLWLTDEDIYAFNSAWLYAMSYFKIRFNENASVVETLADQFFLLRKKAKYTKVKSPKLGISITDPDRAVRYTEFHRELEAEIEKEFQDALDAVSEE